MSKISMANPSPLLKKNYAHSSLLLHMHCMATFWNIFKIFFRCTSDSYPGHTHSHSGGDHTFFQHAVHTE